MAKKVKFDRKKKPGKKKADRTAFDFGANLNSAKKRKGGFGGGS